MKNKLSRFAVPYEVWMAIFVVAPILIMVIYAFSSSEGGFTLDNFVQMGGYTQVFLRSFQIKETAWNTMRSKTVMAEEMAGQSSIYST